MDKHSNAIAKEGCDRCTCGCKYWEHDKCIDCGKHVDSIMRAKAEDLLRRLLVWETSVFGGSEAPVWEDVRNFLEED